MQGIPGSSAAQRERSIDPPPDGRERAPRWLTLLALGLGLFQLTRLLDRPYPRFDSGAYVLGAKALARGLGLVCINHPDLAPFTVYPPVLPAYLSLFARISESLHVMMLGIVISGMLCLLLTLRYYGRNWGPALSALALTAMAGSTFYLFNGRIQGEVPYLAWTLAALLCLERAVELKRLGLHFWVGLACVLCAALTRQIGLSLIAGAGLYVLWAMPTLKRKLLGLAAIGLLAALPYYVVIETLQPGNLSPESTSVLRKRGWRPAAGQIDPLSPELVERARGNLVRSSWYAPQSLLLREGAESHTVRWTLRGLFGLMAAGWLYSLLRRRRAADCYVPAYMGVVLIIPWLVENRFFTVLIPFMFDYLICGLAALAWIASRALRIAQPRAAAVARLAALTLLAGLTLLNAWLLIDRDRPDKWSARDNRAYDACIAARALLDPEAIVLTHDPRAFSVLTGIRALSYMSGEQKYLPPFRLNQYLRQGGRIDAVLFPKADARRVNRLLRDWRFERLDQRRAGKWYLVRVRR